MAEEKINTLDDKFKKLLNIEFINKPNFDVYNVEDFKDFSIEELKNMKWEADSNDTLTEYDKLNIRRNIDHIIDAKEKDERSRQVEDDWEKAQEIRQQIAEEWEKQRQKAEALSKILWKLDNIIYLEQAKSGEIDENTEKIWKDSYTLDELKLCKEIVEDDERKNKIGLSNISEDEHKWLVKNLEKTIKDYELSNTNEENIDTDVKQGKDKEEYDRQNTENSINETEEEKNYKKQLDDLDNANKKLKEQVDLQTKIIANLLVAKKGNNVEDIDKIKKELEDKGEEIKELEKQRDILLENNKKMRDRYFGELPKYNGDIIPLKTDAVEFKFGVNKIEWNQKVLSMPQLLLRKNIISRHRLNKTIKKLNEIWDNPKEWVNYILTKADFFKWGSRIWTLCKRVWNYFRIRDVDTFDRIFNEQKKIFIDDIEAKMQWQMSEDDIKTMKAIRARLDYYQKTYKMKFLTV